MSMIEGRAGGTPVAALDDLTELERRVVGYLRQWCASPCGQAAVWNELAVAAGPLPGRRALEAFEGLLAALASHARRPLTHHAVGCSCVGGDEAAIAALVAAAAAGEREDAALVAAALVRGRGIEETVRAAEAAGAALRAASPCPAAGFNRVERPVLH